MSIEQFESWSLTLGISGLILWMLLIIWKMGKESQAGKFGFFVSADPSRSSVTGVHASQLSAGATYHFNGF